MNHGRQWRRRTCLPNGLRFTYTFGTDQSGTLYDAQEHDRSPCHENCAHEARTRRSERGYRIQGVEGEITNPQHGKVGQARLQVRRRTDWVQNAEEKRSVTLHVVKNSRCQGIHDS